MFKTPWSQKTVAQRLLTIGAMIGIFLGGMIVAFAISNYFTSKSFNVDVDPNRRFEIDLTGQVTPAAMGPGDSMSIAPTIKNTGNTKMYVFVRININSVNGTPAYTFTPAEGSGWTKVETGVDDEIVYCYGDPSTLAVGQSETLSGTMTVALNDEAFSEMPDDALHYTVTGCAIGFDAESTSSAAALYNEYLSSGGD